MRPRLLLCGVSLLGYCILTGMQPPVVRATIMAGVVLGGLWMDRIVNWPNALAAAALVVLWCNPSQMFDPGFQLSFGAVASLLAFVPRIRAVLEPRVSVRAMWLRRYVAVSLASTLAIWIGLWPALAWYFHLVSPISVLANLLLVPLVSLTVAYGTPLVLLGTIWAPVVTCTAGTMTWLVDGIVQLVQWCQAVPFGCWLVGQPSWWVIGGYYGLVMLTLLRSRLRWSPARVVLCWLAGIAVWVWGTIGVEWLASRWLEVTVLDVGHGDSIVIRTPNRQTILVDTGTRQAGQYTVVPFLHFKGWNTLDALILTHPDEDHVGGAIPLLGGVRVKRLLTNGFPATTHTAQAVFAGAEARRIPRAILAAGMRLTGAPGVEMLVLHPPDGFVPGTSPGSNDNSLVLTLHMRRMRMLLCGDLEEAGVPWVLRWGPVLGSTVLKVPHHGSALGPHGRRFLEQVHPAAAVISVGRLHGLPSAEVLEELRAVGARVLLTRRVGAVTIRTDGKRLLVSTFREPSAPLSP